MQLTNTDKFTTLLPLIPHVTGSRVYSRIHNHNGPSYSQRKNVIHFKIFRSLKCYIPFQSMSSSDMHNLAFRCIIRNYNDSESALVSSVFAISELRQLHSATYQRCTHRLWHTDNLFTGGLHSTVISSLPSNEEAWGVHQITTSTYFLTSLHTSNHLVEYMLIMYSIKILCVVLHCLHLTVWEIERRMLEVNLHNYRSIFWLHVMITNIFELGRW
jgi:hypothetical protein